MTELHNLDFEIFGKVQKVFFRVHTEKKANELGLVGWVMNTPSKTVVGRAQGPKPAIEEFKYWLSNVGSPKSKIDRAEFKNEKIVSSAEFTEFVVSK